MLDPSVKSQVASVVREGEHVSRLTRADSHFNGRDIALLEGQQKSQYILHQSLLSDVKNTKPELYNSALKVASATAGWLDTVSIQVRDKNQQFTTVKIDKKELKEKLGISVSTWEIFKSKFTDGLQKLIETKISEKATKEKVEKATKEKVMDKATQELITLAQKPEKLPTVLKQLYRDPVLLIKSLNKLPLEILPMILEQLNKDPVLAEKFLEIMKTDKAMCRQALPLVKAAAELDINSKKSLTDNAPLRGKNTGETIVRVFQTQMVGETFKGLIRENSSVILGMERIVDRLGEGTAKVEARQAETSKFMTKAVQHPIEPELKEFYQFIHEIVKTKIEDEAKKAKESTAKENQSSDKVKKEIDVTKATNEIVAGLFSMALTAQIQNPKFHNLDKFTTAQLMSSGFYSNEIVSSNKDKASEVVEALTGIKQEPKKEVKEKAAAAPSQPAAKPLPPSPEPKPVVLNAAEQVVLKDAAKHIFPHLSVSTKSTNKKTSQREQKHKAAEAPAPQQPVKAGTVAKKVTPPSSEAAQEFLKNAQLKKRDLISPQFRQKFQNVPLDIPPNIRSELGQHIVMELIRIDALSNKELSPDEQRELQALAKQTPLPKDLDDLVTYVIQGY